MAEPISARTLLERQSDERKTKIREKQNAIDNHMSEVRSLQSEIDTMSAEIEGFERAIISLEQRHG